MQTYDPFPPVTGFSYPPNNSILNGNTGGLVPITGTATDQPFTTPGIGVAKACSMKAIQIDSLNGKKYWDGTTWNGVRPGLQPADESESGGWGARPR